MLKKLLKKTKNIYGDKITQVPILDFDAPIDFEVIKKYGIEEYHFRILDMLDKTYGLKGKIVADIGGSNITKEAAEWFGIKKMVCIDPISKWFVDLSYDINCSKYANIGLFKNETFLAAYKQLNYLIVDECAESLTQDYWNKFDIIISISTFEHVESVMTTLNNIYNMLKPTGVLFSSYEPIFSCAKGHHVWIDNEINFTNTPELDFCHLKYSYEEALEFLDTFERFREKKTQIADMIYKSNVINRKTLNQQVSEIMNSKFEFSAIKYWYLDKDINSKDVDSIVAKYGNQRYDVRGIMLTAQK